MGQQNIQANDVNCTDHDVSITMLLVLENRQNQKEAVLNYIVKLIKLCQQLRGKGGEKRKTYRNFERMLQFLFYASFP